MTKAEFYQGKTVAATEWWLNSEWLPELVWGRLRVFNDGSADACFSEGVTVYGFQSREQAARLLASDDLCPLDEFAEEELEEFDLSRDAIETPVWVDAPDQEFVFVPPPS